MKHKYQLLHKGGPSKVQKTEQMVEIPISYKPIQQKQYVEDFERVNIENLYEKFKNKKLEIPIKLSKATKPP